MYEDFGARVDGRSVELSLFLPDNTVDPSQYEGDGDPRIHSLQVAGTFQPHLGTTAWDPATAPAQTPRPHPNGVRWCGDPCARYIIGPDENAGFTVGGSFSGGYNPFALFAAEDRYLAEAGGDPLRRLDRLKRLVTELHRRVRPGRLLRGPRLQQLHLGEPGRGRARCAGPQLDDEAGGRLFALHRQLVRLRQAHPACARPTSTPRPYDTRLERFIVVLNLNGDSVDVGGFRLTGQRINSNWGRIYHQAA